TDDKRPPPGEMLTVTAGHIGQRRGDEPAATGLDFAGRCEPGLPDRVRALPCPRSVDDRPDLEVRRSSIGVLSANKEGSRFTLRGARPVHSDSAHCHNPGISEDGIPEFNCLGQRNEIVPDEFVPWWQVLAVGFLPTG